MKNAKMKNARNPLIGLVALGAALAMPLAFAQGQPTATQDPAAATQDSMQGTPTPTTTTEQAPPADAGSMTQAPQQMTWADVDTDKNGTISKAESAQLASLAQVFDEADANQDGELTPDEYKAYVARNSQPTTGDTGG